MYRSDDHEWHSDVDRRYSAKLTDMITWLDKNQILHHLGDETVMEKLASVEDDALKVGKMIYKTVIVPSAAVVSSNTLALLKAFKQNGGNLVFVGEIPSYVDGVKSDEVKKLAEKHVERTEEVLSLIPESARFIRLAHAGRPRFATCSMPNVISTISRCTILSIPIPARNAPCSKPMAQVPSVSTTIPVRPNRLPLRPKTAF